MNGNIRTAAQARKSALMVAAILLALSAWNVYRERPNVYYTLAALGTLLGLVGLLWPRGAQWFDRTWMRLAAVLGYVNSRILLSLMFYAVMTPYGVILRLAGRNAMNRRGPGAESYWKPRKRTRQMPTQFERLF